MASAASTSGVPETHSSSSNTSDADTRPKVRSACDSCKRRKVKCSGDQPCQRCITSGVSCTYGSAAGRTSALSYTRHLEEKIAELQALLREQPSRHSDNPELRDIVHQSQETARDNLIDNLVGPEDDYLYYSTASSSETFHGRFAGLSILRTVRDLCTKVSGQSQSPSEQYGASLAEAFDVTLFEKPPFNHLSSFALLPSQERLRRTVGIALDYGLSCQQCIDRAKLAEQVETLYRKDAEDLNVDDRHALSVVYALMALGRRYDPEAEEDLGDDEPGVISIRGMSYFRAAHAVYNSSDSNNLDSVRTSICLAQYMLASSMASKAYAFICAGVASALRIGLHVVAHDDWKFSADELSQRRIVFSVLNLMDTYISSMLGMPRMLKDAESKQIIAVPEEEMADEGEAFVAREPLSPISDTILVCKLFRISSEIGLNRYPTNKTLGESGKYETQYETISALERQLKTWHDGLPPLSPDTVDKSVLHSQLTIRFAYTTVRITVYRPFVHHVVRELGDPKFDYKGFECGSECLRASMEAVWLADTMQKQGVLHEAQWFITYNLALAASALMLFVLGKREGPTVAESQAAADRARELLKILGRKNMSARRCFESLDSLSQESTGTSIGSSASPRSQFMRRLGVPEDMEIT